MSPSNYVSFPGGQCLACGQVYEPTPEDEHYDAISDIASAKVFIGQAIRELRPGCEDGAAALTRLSAAQDVLRSFYRSLEPVA